jgi:hypothetical protein
MRLLIGISIYVVLSSILVVPAVRALKRAHNKHLPTTQAASSVLPYLIASGVLTVVFLIWFVSQLL